MRIGIDNFIKKIKEGKTLYIYKENEFYLESLNKYEIPKPEKINEAKIECFLLRGKLEEKYCVNGYINNDKKPPFLIKRTQILNALEILQKENSICINADIGNGKTLFLRQLAIELLREGKQVYHNFDDKGDIESYIVGYKKDIEKLAKLKQEIFIILDSCCKYDALLQFIFERKYTNIKIILADRTVKWINYIRNTSYNIKNIY